MKTRGLKRLINSGILIILLAAIFSCNQSNKKQGKIDKDQIKSEIEEVVYPLPSPFELTKMLNEIEATFIIGITNPPENVENYLILEKQALNLGVYSSDLAYAATYNLTNEIQLHLNTIKKLAEDLDITGAIKQDLLIKIENSLNNKEQITEVITDLFYETYSYLNKNNNTDLSYLILSGTWIEGMYLTLNISDNTFDNINIVKIIMKQEESLKKLLELMEEMKGNQLLKDVYEKLIEINKVYELEKGTDALSQKQLIKISDIITNYREEIVK